MNPKQVHYIGNPNYYNYFQHVEFRFYKKKGWKMKPSYQKFNDLITTKNVSAYEIAKETGIPASTFSDWKSGRSAPKIEKLLKISTFLDVPVESLVDNEEPLNSTESS